MSLTERSLEQSDTSSASSPHLPLPANPFVGRTSEVETIHSLLLQNRLITIWGMGGIGKTRLATHVAHQMAQHFEDGVYYISLVSVERVEQLLPELIDALSLSTHAHTEQQEQLFNYLHKKRILLLFDNYEQLLPSVDLLNDLLDAAPNVTLLVTSRHRLNCQSETVFPLDGLSTSANVSGASVQHSEAVELFLQVASQVDVVYQIPVNEMQLVADICQLLEGLPLAIELAASWVRLLPCQAIFEELSKNLELLVTTNPQMPERHRSMRAVLDYSWQLLDADEKRLFCQLCVFTGPFDYHAAIEITGATLLELRSLVDQSLIQVSAERFLSLHPLLLEFGQEKFDSYSEVVLETRNRHSAHYINWLSSQQKRLEGAEQIDALDAISFSLDNLRSAWEWAIEQGALEDLEGASLCFASFFEYRSRFKEGLELFTMATQMVDPTQWQNEALETAYLKLCTWQALFLWKLGDKDTAYELIQQSLEQADQVNDLQWTVNSMRILESLLFERGEYVEAALVTKQQTELSRQIADQANLFMALISATSYEMNENEFDKAKKFALEALQVAMESGNFRNQMIANNALGTIANTIPNYAESRRYFQKALESGIRIKDKLYEALINENLGTTALYEGYDLRDSGEHLYEAYKIAHEIGALSNEASILSTLGFVLTQQGEFSKALSAYKDAAAIYEGLRGEEEEIWLTYHEGYTYMKLGNYEKAQLNFVAVLERLSTHSEQFLECTVLTSMASTYWRSGSIVGPADNGEACAKRALQLAKDIDFDLMIISASACLALILLKNGHLDDAYLLCQNILEIDSHIAPNYFIDIYCTLAQIESAKNQHQKALNYVEKIRATLAKYEIVDATMVTYEAYTICNSISTSGNRTKSDDEPLRLAHERLNHVANKIENIGLQQSFLQIPPHQQILEKSRTKKIESRQTSAKTPKNVSHGLTKREVQVLCLLAKNYTNSQIADELVVSTSTVKRHVYNIYQKLNVSRRVEAAQISRQLGLNPEA